MSLGLRIAHNTLYLIVGKIISTALGVTTIALLLRYLSPDDYGRYTAVIAFVLLLGTVTDFGLNLSTTQDISENNQDTAKTINSVFTARIIANVILLALLPAILMLFPYEHTVKQAIMLTSLLFFANSLFQILTAYFQKTLQAGKIAIAELGGRVMLFASTLLAIQFRFTFLELMLTVIASGFAQLWVMVHFTSKEFPIVFSVDWTTWKRIARKTWPIALSVVFTTIYFKGDAVILSLVRPFEDVGIYGAAYKILEVLITVPILIMGLILPHLTARYSAKDLEGFHTVIQSTWDALSLITIPMVIGTVAIAHPIIQLIAGDGYEPAARVLQILIVAAGIIFLGSIFTHAIVAINKQKTMVPFYAAAAVGSIALYVLFIPMYTYYAAAAVTVLAEFFIASVAAYKVLSITRRLSFAYFNKSLLASIGMGIVLASIPTANVFLLLPLGALCYIGLIALLGVRAHTFYKSMHS